MTIPGLLILLLLRSPAGAAESELQGYVLGVSGGRVSIDLGAAQGLKVGDVGVIKRAGQRLASLEVVEVDRGSAFLRVIGDAKGLLAKEGDSVFFAPAAQPRAGAGQGGEEEFVPLLAPVSAVKKKAVSRVSTQTHGRVRAWQFYQTVDPVGARYTISRLDSDGTVDRIAGGPWSFVWAGNGSYRDSNRSSGSDDFRRPRPHASRLTLSRPLGAKGFLRAGRFFPNELPGLGTVDGAALQRPLGPVKIGAVAGTRPDRRYHGFSSREIAAALYAAAETGAPGRGSYGATLGALHTRWLGKADELALLLDQRFDLGPMLSVYQTAQFDFNAGTAAVHKGTRLTRLDLSVHSAPALWLGLRAGLNHFEPIDVAAERSLAGVDPALYIDNGYWRFWTGTSQTLPWGLGFDEEISWTNAAAKSQPGLWRVTASRQGLPWLPAGRVYATAYNFHALSGSDYGGSTGVQTPFFEGRFSVDSSLGLRYDRDEETRRHLEVNEVHVRATWRPSRTWDADLAFSRIWHEPIHSTSVSGGVSYRW